MEIEESFIRLDFQSMRKERKKKRRGERGKVMERERRNPLTNECYIEDRE